MLRTLSSDILPSWESNLGLLHCRQILYHLSYMDQHRIPMSCREQSHLTSSCKQSHWSNLAVSSMGSVNHWMEPTHSNSSDASCFCTTAPLCTPEQPSGWPADSYPVMPATSPLLLLPLSRASLAPPDHHLPQRCPSFKMQLTHH